MRWIDCILVVAFAGSISLQGQTQTETPAQPPPQTARQALIEMFMGKAADAFEKHLPEVAHQALIRKGETPDTSIVQRIAMIGRQMTAQGEHLETFDVGPMLLVTEQEGGRERIEVILEHDSFLGEEEEIEVSVQVYRSGKPEFLPVLPRLIFTMKQEKEIWRLIEMTVAAHVPLTDPDYLKGVRKQQDQANENMASARVGFIASAEASYAAKHPDRGYTCKVTDLFAKEDSANVPDQPADVASPDWANGESSGYRFSLSGCDGSPVLKFRVTAVPTESESGLKAFCADESGKIRFASDGKGPACLSRGQLLNPETTNPPIQAD